MFSRSEPRGGDNCAAVPVLAAISGGTATYATPSDATKIGWRSAVVLIFAVMASLPILVDPGLRSVYGLVYLLGVSTTVLTLVMVSSLELRLGDPRVLAGMVVTHGISLKLIYAGLAQGRRGDFEVRLLNGQDASVLVTGSAVVLPALLLLYLGLMLPLSGARLPSMLSVPGRIDNRKLLAVGLATLVVAGFALVYWARLEGFSPTSPETWSSKRFNSGEGAQERTSTLGWLLYRIASLARIPLLLMVAVRSCKRDSIADRPTYRAVVIGLLAVSLAVPFFANSRSGMALVIVDIAIIHSMAGKRSRFGRRQLAAGCLALVALVAMLDARSNSDASRLDLVEQTIAGRDLMDIGKTSQIVDAVPDRVPNLNGETILGALVDPLPGVEWDHAVKWNQLGRYVFSDIYELNGQSGIPAGFLGEMWLNFGWPGVLVGSVLLGTALRMLYVTFLPHSRSPAALAVYTILVMRLTVYVLGNDVGTGFWKTILDLVPLLLLIVVVSQPSQDDRADVRS